MNTPRNHNRWTEAMTIEAMGRVASANIPTKTSKYGEPTLDTTFNSLAALQEIADILNDKYQTSLTPRSIIGRYQYVSSTEEQRQAKLERRRKSRRLKKKANTANVTSGEQFVVEVARTIEEPSPAPPYIDVVEVVVRCSRLISDGAVTKQELMNLLNMI
tara:strand:+ start:504 stop:983 length:480 start_codon:yes stop_codon:yes gene_type:complete